MLGKYLDECWNKFGQKEKIQFIKMVGYGRGGGCSPCGCSKSLQ